MGAIDFVQAHVDAFKDTFDTESFVQFVMILNFTI